MNSPYTSFIIHLKSVLLAAICLLSIHAKAQEEQRYNRFQYHKYKWKALHTKTFHIYFPAGNDSLGFFIAGKTPIAIEKIKKRMITASLKESNIIIYPSLDQQFETNIGSFENMQYTLPTFVSKGNRALVAYNGNYRDLENQLYESLARSAWEEQMKDEGKTSNSDKNAKTPAKKSSKNETIPSWFKEGAILYFAHGWTIEAEDKLRNSFAHNNFTDWQQIQRYEPKLSGHAFCYFLTEKYFPTAVAQTVIQLKKKKSLPRVLKLVTKHTLDSLYTQCFNYYRHRFEKDIAKSKKNTSANPIPITFTIPIPHKQGMIQDLLISSDKTYIAYTFFYSGKRTIYIYNTQSKETNRIAIYKMPPWIDDHSSDLYPLLAWHPDGKQLFVTVPIKGKIHISRYTVDGNLVETIPLYGVDGIKTIQPLSDKEFLLTAFRKGQSDIVKYDENRELYTPYTNDAYDDAYPILNKKDSSIIFVSDRPKKREKKVFYIGLGYKSDTLYQGIYKIQGKELKPLAIDSTSYVQWDKPLQLANGQLLVSNTKSGTERFSLLGSNGNKGNTLGNYERIQYESQSDQVAFYTTKKDSIYISEEPLDAWMAENKASLSDTASPWLTDYRIRQAKEAKEDSILKAARDTTNTFLGNVLKPVGKKKTKETKKKKKKSESEDAKVVSPYILQLNSAYFTAKINNDYFINRYQPYQNYQGQFKFPEVGGMAQGGLSDLFENHHFTIAYRIPAGTEGSDFFIKYENTERKIDWGLSYFRKVESLQPDPYRNWVDENGQPYPNTAKVKTHYYEFFLKDPLTYDCYIGFETAVRDDRTIFLATDKRSLDFEDYTDLWSINTVSFTLNKLQPTLPFLFKGFYIKAIMDVFKGLSQSEPILFGSTLDMSYHKPLYKYITLVAQVHAGYSGGGQKVLYNLGGVDNNVTPRVDTNVHFAQNAPYAFQTLVTPFRGYYQNTLYGNQYTVANADIYFPIFQTLIPIETPLPSINNLQLGIFEDLGSAKETWNSNPNNAKWLWSYGLSVRTSLAGYPLRIDLAWPGDQNRQAVWYFSLKL